VPPPPPPPAGLWFLRVLVAFVRRELAALGGYRAAFVTRVAGLATVGASLVFFARFGGASANPHLAAYGGNYLGFAALGFLTAGFQQVGLTGLAQRVRNAPGIGKPEGAVDQPRPTP